MIKRKVLSVIKYLILSCSFIIFTYPFYHIFVLATRKRIDIYTTPPPFFFGDAAQDNLRLALDEIPFYINVFNSVLIAVLATAGTIFFCTMVAFALAKYDFKWKNFMLSFVIATMAIPPFLGLIPFVRIMIWIGWIDTPLPLIIPSMAGAFGVFLMTQYLKNSIPIDLVDAARIDGLGEFQILLKVVFPLAKPGLAVLGIVSFVASWNNFLGALVVLTKKEIQTIPVALSVLQGRADIGVGPSMVANAIALIPLLIVFLIFSKQIISNLLAGSIRE